MIVKTPAVRGVRLSNPHLDLETWLSNIVSLRTFPLVSGIVQIPLWICRTRGSMRPNSELPTGSGLGELLQAKTGLKVKLETVNH